MKNTLKIKPIIRIMGRLVLIESLMLLIPLAVCLCYGEGEWKGFAIAAVAAATAGGIAELATRHVSTAVSYTHLRAHET